MCRNVKCDVLDGTCDATTPYRRRMLREYHELGQRYDLLSRFRTALRFWREEVFPTSFMLRQIREKVA